MSISRTILARPRRSREAGGRRARSRLALAATLLLGVSACTAVAAEGLPGVDRRATHTATVEASGPPPALSGRGGAAPPPGTTPTAALLAADDRAAIDDAHGRSLLIAKRLATGASRGTIVAHATSPTVVARQRPADAAEPVTEFANPTDRGGPLVFQAIGEPTRGWLEVLLPVRPNGTTGWIDLDDVTLSRNPYRIEVDLERYQLTVRRNGEVEIAAPVAIGQGGTPTPVGDFYLVELLQPPEPNGPYGSYAYGLSGYSDVLDNFNGGPGVIGIHGTNRPDLLGGPASHGCIRIHNDTIELMAEFLPLGTPVSIIEADGDG